MLRTTRSRYPVFLALSFVRRFRHTRDLFLDHSLVQRLMNSAMLQSLDLSPKPYVGLLGSDGWLGQLNTSCSCIKLCAQRASAVLCDHGRKTERYNFS